MVLWTSDEIAEATGGVASGAFAVTGVAYDSREVGPGDLFVALKGESTDGHRFVAQAFRQAAAGVLVSEAADGPHVRVADTEAALNALARAARARTQATIIGVTGSVGKTGTKEALWSALDRIGPGTAHRSVKSYNNHVGVPLSLARMPREARFAVFEMGMNHAGELDRLTRLVRPHVAAVTAIAPAHSAFFSSEAAIADAKAEIFRGLEPGGAAVIPYDSPHRDRLLAAGAPHAATVLTFGLGEGADVRAADAVRGGGAGTLVNATLPGGQLTFSIGLGGDHWVSNALCVLACVEAAGGDLAAAGLALAEMSGLPGRGARVRIALPDGDAVLIDESYNANPGSMAATIRELGREPGRRLAVLGEMRELGEGSDAFHRALAAPLAEAGVAHVVLVGEGTAPLAEALSGRIDVMSAADATEARDRLAALIRPGDAVLVKGSNAIGLSRVVASLAAEPA